MVGGQAPQPAEELGDVAAEGAAERVELVDHHVAEAPEERAPPLVVRQQAGVEHLRVGEHDVGLLADPGALLGRGVAVVGPGHHLREVERGERPQLVVGQRLGGEQDQPRARPDRLGDGLADGQLVAAGLARPRARGDDDGAAGPGQVEGLDLVRPQRLRHGGGQALRERTGQLGRAGGSAGQVGEVHEAAGLVGADPVGVEGLLAVALQLAIPSGGQLDQHLTDLTDLAGRGRVVDGLDRLDRWDRLDRLDREGQEGHGASRAYAVPVRDDRAVVPSVGFTGIPSVGRHRFCANVPVFPPIDRRSLDHGNRFGTWT